jgi:PAB1-binding protein PBP1
MLRQPHVGLTKRHVGLSMENDGILKDSVATLITPWRRFGQHVIRKGRLVETRERKVTDDSPEDPKTAELPMTGLEKGNENMECN